MHGYQQPSHSTHIVAPSFSQLQPTGQRSVWTANAIADAENHLWFKSNRSTFLLISPYRSASLPRAAGRVIAPRPLSGWCARAGCNYLDSLVVMWRITSSSNLSSLFVSSIACNEAETRTGASDKSVSESPGMARVVQSLALAAHLGGAVRLDDRVIGS